MRYAVALSPSFLLLFGYDYLPEVFKLTPIALQYPLVFLTCWLGGLVPGIISIILALIYIKYHIGPGHLNPLLSGSHGTIRLIIFFATSALSLGLFFSLRRALNKAHDAVALRDDFLNLISHELRTPLTALKLNMGVAKRIGKDEGSQEASNFILESSVRQVDRLEGLVSAMMDLTLFDLGQLILMKKTCDLKVIILETVSSFDKSNIIFNEPEDEYLGHWDQKRVEQIVLYIIQNAVKYGEGKPIQISLGSDDRYIWFSVNDNGPGVAFSEQMNIFERFQRANNLVNVQGLGLGLYLTKIFVEAHEGKIKLESTPGAGSCFTIKLPA